LVARMQHERRALDFFTNRSTRLIQDSMTFKHMSKGSYLYLEGDPADKLHLVHAGRVRSLKGSDNGRTFTMYVHQQGDLLGDMNIYQNSVHMFSAEVTESSTIGIISMSELEHLLRQHRELTFDFMKWMGFNHKLTQAKLRDLTLFGKAGALCSLLIRLGNSYGINLGSSTFIDRKFSHAELAEMIATTRESVSRMLSDLKNKDVIEYLDGHIMIKRDPYLRAKCKCDTCSMSVCRI